MRNSSMGLRQQVNPPQTLQALGQALVNQWRRLPVQIFRGVLQSMRRRCVAVVAVVAVTRVIDFSTCVNLYCFSNDIYILT